MEAGSEQLPFLSSTQRRGWLWSAAIHGAVLGGMVWGGAALPQRETQEVFQWEVQLAAGESASVSSTEVDHAMVRSERLTGESVPDLRPVPAKAPAHVTARREMASAAAPQVEPAVLAEGEVISLESVAVATDGNDGSLATDVYSLSMDSSVETSRREPSTDDEQSRPTGPADEPNVPEPGVLTAVTQTPGEPISDDGPPAQSDRLERASSRRDFGWVGLALRARVEEVKRYSLDARLNEWEGRTVVAVEILADGRITNARVVESSGNVRLDEDACALVSSVSPLKLARAIEADRLMVKIPIVFGLR